MYLRNDGFSGYDRSGAQIRQRGLFLLLIQPDIKGGVNCPIKAVIRKVALKQFGHWMMGKANIGGHWYSVSGSYGHDGLPMTVTERDYCRHGLPLTAELHDAWNKGGGHNSCGSEAEPIRKWALENLPALCQ